MQGAREIPVRPNDHRWLACQTPGWPCPLHHAPPRSVVHRMGEELLRKELKAKTDFILKLALTPLQASRGRKVQRMRMTGSCQGSLSGAATPGLLQLGPPRMLSCLLALLHAARSQLPAAASSQHRLPLRAGLGRAWGRRRLTCSLCMLINPCAEPGLSGVHRWGEGPWQAHHVPRQGGGSLHAASHGTPVCRPCSGQAAVLLLLAGCGLAAGCLLGCRCCLPAPQAASGSSSVDCWLVMPRSCVKRKCPLHPECHWPSPNNASQHCPPPPFHPAPFLRP